MESEKLEFIKEHSVGIVSTCDNDMPHGVPIYYYFDKEKELFYFVTKDATKKYSNLSKNKNVFLTIFRENPQAVFTAECVAEPLDCSKDDCIDIMDSLIEVHSTQEYYPSPISMLKEGTLKLIKLEIKNSNFKSYRKDI